MNLLLRVVGLLLLCLAGSALAQPYAYNVYIDADLRTSTGCTVSGGGQTFEGADFRLTATVSGTPPVVTARALSICINGNFTPGNPLTAGYPVGLNNGLGVAAASRT
ncbi:MAG: hypothetical protein JNL89_10410 [Rhodanobacteraceae bacterium]|nr:hypothetical protein [Rhodanobacteraceae bacterium]